MTASIQAEIPKRATRHPSPLPAAEQSREETIVSLLPFVRHIAGRMNVFLPNHISKDDLISAGVIGLIDAVDRFDASKGASLRTYCALRIRGAIVDELRKQEWAPRSVLKDSKLLSETQQRLAQELGREPLENEIRAALKLSPEEFDHLLERTRPALFFSLHEPAHEGDESTLTHEEVLADPDCQDSLALILRAEDRRLVLEYLHRLPLQQIQVLSLYYMENLRLKEIAEILKVTESRISQIHTLAVSRLRSMFQKAHDLPARRADFGGH